MSEFARFVETDAGGFRFIRPAVGKSAQWDESKHPRDDGKFASSPGTSRDDLPETHPNSSQLIPTHPEADGATPASASTPPVDTPDPHTAKLLALTKDAPPSLLRRAGSFVAQKFSALRAKYGLGGAVAILSASVAMAPIPVPGTVLIPVALANAVVRLKQKLVGSAVGKAEPVAELDPETVQALARELLEALYAEMGEKPPEVSAPVDTAEPAVEKSAKHAPKGGISLAGKKFSGGEFIPAEDLEKASPEERAELKRRAGKGSPERVPKHERHGPTSPAPAPSAAESPADLDPLATNPETGLVDHARVGVPAMTIPPPPPVPRLPNLPEKQAKVEARYAEAYEANPDKFADQYLKALHKRKVGVEPNVFATDDAKMLNPDWNPGKARPGEELDKATQKAMAKNNTAVHQTANAVAKRAFLKYLDTLPPEKRTVLVTQGGCAAGKGSSLARAADPNSPYAGILPAADHVGAVWDAAGEQNGTENEWVLEECKKRGIKVTFAYVYADPTQTWEAPDRGVIRRAIRKGRMVDCRLFADSYALGAKNMDAFHQKHKDDPNAAFIFVDNREKGNPKLMDGVPKEALAWDAEKIYKDAVASLESHKADLPKALIRGGLAGTQIWGPPKAAEQQPSEASRA